MFLVCYTWPNFYWIFGTKIMLLSSCSEWNFFRQIFTLKNTYSVHWQGANMRPNDPMLSIQADRNRLKCPDYCPSRLFLNLFQQRSFLSIQNLKLFLWKLRDANFESTQHLQMNRLSLSRPVVHDDVVQADVLFHYREHCNVFRSKVLKE